MAPPLVAGALKVPYWQFLIANASGGSGWASGTVFPSQAPGRVAGGDLQGLPSAALVLAVTARFAHAPDFKRPAPPPASRRTSRSPRPRWRGSS